MSLWRCQRIRRSRPSAQGSFRPLLTSHLLTSHWPKPVLRSGSRCTTELHGNRYWGKERQRAGTRWRVLLQTMAPQHMLCTAPHKISLSPIQWFDICIWASQMVLLVKNLPANAGDMRRGFSPWVGKIPCRRAWQPTPVFLPGESHGLRSLACYNPQGHK